MLLADKDWVRRGLAGLATARLAAWRGLLISGLFLFLLAYPTPSQGGWFTKLIREAAEAGGSTARKSAKVGAGHLDNAAAHLKKINLPDGRPGLAAEITDEGHWRFVNKAGETYTAGTPEELSRAFSTLLPGKTAGAGKGLKPALVLTARSIYRHRALLKDLPEHGPLFVVINKKNYPLLLRGSGDKTRAFARLRKNLSLEMRTSETFEEAYWQVNRGFNQADIRLLSLQPGSTRIVPAARRRAKNTGLVVAPEPADPFALAKSMASIRGQTVLLSGRIEGSFLHFKPVKGSAGAVRLKQLRKAADKADVNLIIVNTGSAAQPGSRNWLWQRRQVNGLARAMAAKTRADFLEALVGGRGPFLVRTKLHSDGRRVSLETASLLDKRLLPSSDGLTNIFTDSLSHLAGELVSQSVAADLRSKRYQDELDWRLIPGIPSNYQIFYGMLLVLALIGLPVSRRWWRRIWPLEERSQYAGPFGYYAARSVRLLVFVLLFMPLTAIAAVPVHFLQRLWHWLTLPVRLWRWLVATWKAA